MYDANLTVTTVLDWARELAIIGGVIIFGWHARGFYQSVADFKDSIVDFMGFMRGFADRLEHNHFHHIEESLNIIATKTAPLGKTTVHVTVDPNPLGIVSDDSEANRAV